MSRILLHSGTLFCKSILCAKKCVQKTAKQKQCLNCGIPSVGDRAVCYTITIYSAQSQTESELIS